ncbi:ASCH domain-containing protein [Paracoccus sp. (in: a-proteobacteria)]|uniref:ASCH domain-containing protein n=1 Tax=Paracoccus sp. TaxID=267 RepID=UPI002AFFDF59|nr:ASCH domain-containing protein [Paracoccus sp. (in: a-proteobacteria)]
MKALSIRQPWAWCILHGKPVENRRWWTPYTGPLLIHAAKGMTRAEYEDCRDFAASLGLTVPPADELPRGGIVGMARLSACVTHHPSKWFFGPYGLVLEDVQPLPFRPLRGMLGLFEVEEENG